MEAAVSYEILVHIYKTTLDHTQENRDYNSLPSWKLKCVNRYTGNYKIKQHDLSNSAHISNYVAVMVGYIKSVEIPLC
jgi:hypothetical protein